MKEYRTTVKRRTIWTTIAFTSVLLGLIIYQTLAILRDGDPFSFSWYAYFLLFCILVRWMTVLQAFKGALVLTENVILNSLLTSKIEWTEIESI